MYLPYWHLVAKVGRSTLHLLADIPPLTSSDHEWQFQVSIVTAHINRSTGRSTPPHTNVLWDKYYEMYLAAILDSTRKGGNFLLFLNNLGSKHSVSIVESCQLYHPHNILNNPETPQNTPKMRIKDFNSDNSYLPSLTCNMDVRVHIGRSGGRFMPPYWHLVAKVGRSTLYLLADVPYWHLVVMNGIFRFLLSQLI